MSKSNRKKYTRIKKSEYESIIKSYCLGESSVVISAKYGCAPIVILEILRKSNILIRGQDYAGSRKEKIVGLYLDGKTREEIKDITGESEDYIYNSLFKFGLTSRKKKIPAEEYPRIFRLRSLGKSYQFISEIYGVWPNSIKGILTREPKSKRACAFKPSVDEIHEIVNKYNDYQSINDLYEEYSCDPRTIKKILLSQGVKLRTHKDAANRHELNQHYFKKIDTQEKGYFFGWMCSDGNVDKNHKCFSLGIQERDIEILEFFKSKLSSDYRILFHGRERVQNIVKLYIGGEQIVSDLEKYGCVPNKTYTLEFPKLDNEEAYRGFILGMIEGDGGVYFYNNTLTVALTGTYEVCKGLSEFILDKFNIYTKINRKPTYSVWKIYSKNADILLNYLYSNVEFKLKRKFDIYTKYLDYKNNGKNKVITK